MNYRLKNRTVFPPVGFQFVQPQMGWDSSKMAKGATLEGIARAVVELRKANPHLTQKHGLSTDYRQVLQEVDEYTAAVCAARGYMDAITQGEFPKPLASPASLRANLSGRFAAAVGGVKHIVAGVNVLLAWLGSGGRPVEPGLAEARAQVCAGCPQNVPGDWKSRFTGPAAEEIKLQLGIKHDLKLSTSRDAGLRVCNACECQLELKVWCPLEHILKETSEETKTRLDARCWILSEGK